MLTADQGRAGSEQEMSLSAEMGLADTGQLSSLAFANGKRSSKCIILHLASEQGGWQLLKQGSVSLSHEYSQPG